MTTPPLHYSWWKLLLLWSCGKRVRAFVCLFWGACFLIHEKNNNSERSYTRVDFNLFSLSRKREVEGEKRKRTHDPKQRKLNEMKASVEVTPFVILCAPPPTFPSFPPRIRLKYCFWRACPENGPLALSDSGTWLKSGLSQFWSDLGILCMKLGPSSILYNVIK